jgi:hypothetical protein
MPNWIIRSFTGSHTFVYTDVLFDMQSKFTMDESVRSVLSQAPCKNHADEVVLRSNRWWANVSKQTPMKAVEVDSVSSSGSLQLRLLLSD